MNCPSCNADYHDDLERCPFCGTNNPSGSLKAQRKRLFKIKDNLASLVEDSYTSMNELLKASFKKAFLLMVLCVALGLALGFLFVDVDSYDLKYNQELIEELEFFKDHYAELEKAYLLEDYDGLEDFYYDHYRAFSFWDHHDIYTLSQKAHYLERELSYLKHDEKVDYYVLEEAMYLIYKPSYFVDIDFDDEEIERYHKLKEVALKVLDTFGLDEHAGHILYQACLENGYLESDLLQEALQ